MSSDHDVRKKRYQDVIIRHIHENPQLYLDLDSPSERHGRPVEAKPNMVRFGRGGPAAKPSETERAFGAGLYDGFTFNAGDEISAALDAIPAWFDDRDAGQIYDDELKRIRAETAYLQEQHPVAYGGGQVVGTLAQPLNYTGVGWAGRGASLAAQATRAAAVGGAGGALQGFSDGEGGFGNRVAGGARGAAIGAAAGGALPVAGRLVTEPATTAMARSIVMSDAEVPAVKQFIRNMQYGRDGGVDWSRLPSHIRDLMFARNGGALQNRAQLLRDAEFDTIPKGTPIKSKGKQYYWRTDGFVPADEVEALMNGWVGRSKIVTQIGKNRDVPQFESIDKTRRSRGMAPKKSQYAQTGYQTNLERKLSPADKHYGFNAHINVLP
jgi:hypothetical protein